MDDMDLMALQHFSRKYFTPGAPVEKFAFVDATAALKWWADYDEMEHGILTPTRYHTLQLPYPYTVFYGRTPPEILADGVRVPNESSMCTTLIMCTQLKRSEITSPSYLTLWDRAETTASLLLARAYYGAGSKGLFRLGDTVLPLDQGGVALREMSGVSISEEFLRVLEKRGKSEENARYSLLSMCQPAYFSIALMHAKNIVVRDNPVSRAARRRGEVLDPRVRSYTLEVTGVRAASGGHTTTASGQLLNALHMCRGNFATYSEANRLFGRYTGTFWRSAHVKGHASRGTVVKDYKVKP